MHLKDKVALVLGAVKGIGKAIGLSLAREGVQLALTYYDWEDSLDSMKKDFKEAGADHHIIKCDLCDTTSIRELVDKVIRTYGRLDILINNIERGGWPIVHGSYIPSQWDLEMTTTLRAKQWVFEHALPHLINSGDGAVINLSSISGIVGRSGPVSLVFNEGYSAANRGISLLTETWARLGAPNVRVNEIMLGIFDTRHGPGTRGWNLLTNQQKQRIIDHTLLKRTGHVDDVTRTILYILKDAPFMTGSVIRLDGGYVLGGEELAEMPEGVV